MSDLETQREAAMRRVVTAIEDADWTSVFIDGGLISLSWDGGSCDLSMAYFEWDDWPNEAGDG